MRSSEHVLAAGVNPFPWTVKLRVPSRIKRRDATAPDWIVESFDVIKSVRPGLGVRVVAAPIHPLSSQHAKEAHARDIVCATPYRAHRLHEVTLRYEKGRNEESCSGTFATDRDRASVGGCPYRQKRTEGVVPAPEVLSHPAPLVA